MLYVEPTQKIIAWLHWKCRYHLFSL